MDYVDSWVTNKVVTYLKFNKQQVAFVAYRWMDIVNKDSVVYLLKKKKQQGRPFHLYSVYPDSAHYQPTIQSN